LLEKTGTWGKLKPSKSDIYYKTHNEEVINYKTSLLLLKNFKSIYEDFILYICYNFIFYNQITNQRIYKEELPFNNKSRDKVNNLYYVLQQKSFSIFDPTAIRSGLEDFMYKKGVMYKTFTKELQIIIKKYDYISSFSNPLINVIQEKQKDDYFKKEKMYLDMKALEVKFSNKNLYSFMKDKCVISKTEFVSTSENLTKKRRSTILQNAYQPVYSESVKDYLNENSHTRGSYRRKTINYCPGDSVNIKKYTSSGIKTPNNATFEDNFKKNFEFDREYFDEDDDKPLAKADRGKTSYLDNLQRNLSKKLESLEEKNSQKNSQNTSQEHYDKKKKNRDITRIDTRSTGVGIDDKKEKDKDKDKETNMYMNYNKEGIKRKHKLVNEYYDTSSDNSSKSVKLMERKKIKHMTVTGFSAKKKNSNNSNFSSNSNVGKLPSVNLLDRIQEARQDIMLLKKINSEQHEN